MSSYLSHQHPFFYQLLFLFHLNNIKYKEIWEYQLYKSNISNFTTPFIWDYLTIQIHFPNNNLIWSKQKIISSMNKQLNIASTWLILD